MVVTICTQCAQVNPEGFQFCGACGTALVAAAGPAREVRKTVTALFCDVVGSTPLGERLDPEELRSVMDRYFAEMRVAAEGHGGRVEKFIGDAVFAVFGVPQLHEDDALRAVRAAGEMRTRLVDLNESLRAQGSVELEARMGVCTGEVVVGGDDQVVVGDVMNTAARLQAVAPAGAGRRAKRPSCDQRRDRGRIARPGGVEGETDVGRGVAGGRGRRRGAAGSQPGTVGPSWAGTGGAPAAGGVRAGDRGGPGLQLVTVVGEPGIGKSRLIAELEEWLGVAVGRGGDIGGAAASRMATGSGCGRWPRS